MARVFVDWSDLPDLPLNRLPGELRCRAFGVDYARIPSAGGDELYLTRFGWPLRRYLDPQVWHHGGAMVPFWNKLPGGTGSVYRTSVICGGHSFEIVVKYARFAQEVPLFVESARAMGLSSTDMDDARFNSPFEEFGLLMDLRSGGMAPHLPRVRTKRPLAIYSPATRYPLWQLGRTESRFVPYAAALRRDQHLVPDDAAARLHIDRDYLMVFAYIKGVDAETLFSEGRLSREEFDSLSPMVTTHLRQRGFRVLDDKPKHYILRPLNGRALQPGPSDPDIAPASRTPCAAAGDGLLRRHGRLVWAIVDFELMQRTREYAHAMLGAMG